MALSRAYLAETPIALAHRGGALYAPNIGLENTMTAFRNAVDLGYTHLETDVHATRDGRLVAFHDDVLDRVTDRTGRIKDLTWDEIAQARLVGTGPDSTTVETVPLLTDIIDAFPGINLNIDLKAAGTASLLWEVIDARGLHDRFCVGSFQQRSISEFRKLAGGRVATAASQAGTALMRFGPRALSRLVRTPADVFQIPTSTTMRGREIRLVTRKLVDVAHRHGKQVHVWTIDEAEEMDQLLDLGVDGLVTDRIDTLKDVLTRRDLWHGAG